ncbi:MAG TPA: nitroreductase family protein [Planctomycetota bacterium]|nr:nitroreductase family protein [Planctomycetota bacterium]
MDYEGLLELMRTRRSVRTFSDRPLDHVDVERLIEAARWAPSNHNRQGWKFIVFEDRRRLSELGEKVRSSVSRRLEQLPRITGEHAGQMIRWATLFADAPCVVLAMHKRSAAVGRELLSGARRPELVSGESLSTAMAVQNLLLAAHALGLGACVLTAPLLAGEVWEELDDLPMGFEPTCVIALGYPNEQPPPPRRKTVAQILDYR